MSEKRSLKPSHAFIGAFLVLVFLLFGGGATAVFGKWSGAAGELVILGIALAVTAISGADLKEPFPMSAVPIKKVFASIAMMLGALCLASAVNVITSRFITDYADRSIGIINTVRSMRPWEAILTVAVFPAVCEEMFCRGFVGKALSSVKHRAVRIIANGFIFGILHIDLYTFFPTMIIGILFAYIAEITGSLLIPMMLHFGNNLYSVIMSYNAEMPENMPSGSVGLPSFAQMLGVVLASVSLSVLLLVSSGRALNDKRVLSRDTRLIYLLASVLLIAGSVIVGL